MRIVVFVLGIAAASVVWVVLDGRDEHRLVDSRMELVRPRVTAIGTATYVSGTRAFVLENAGWFGQDILVVARRPAEGIFLGNEVAVRGEARRLHFARLEDELDFDLHAPLSLAYHGDMIIVADEVFRIERARTDDVEPTAQVVATDDRARGRRRSAARRETPVHASTTSTRPSTRSAPAGFDPSLPEYSPRPRTAVDRSPIIEPGLRRPTVVVAVGGGIEAAFAPELGDSAEVWGLRVLADLSPRIGLEVGYLGAANAEHVSTSFEGVAKWYLLPGRKVRPYGLVGVGWRRFHAPVDRDVAQFPVGGGLVYVGGRWYADARLTFRPTTSATLHTVGATAHVGLAF